MDSILTNYSAMVALQSLEMTQTQLANTQQQISTGLKINSAKDNAATWAVSTNMNSSIAALQQVSTNLGSADSAVGLAVSGTSQLASLLTQLNTQVTSAQDPTTDPTQVQNNITALLGQINSVIQSSSYNGLNLLTSNAQVNFLASVNTAADGSSTPNYITVNGANLSTGVGGALASLSGLSVESVGDQLFNASNSADVTAAQESMATRQVTTTVDSGNLGANDTFQVAYTNSSGAASTLNVSLANTANMTASQLATALNADSGFSSLFNASVDSNGNLAIGAANRSEETGSFAIGGITDTTNANGLLQGAVLNTVGATAANDQFTVNYTNASGAQTLTTTGVTVAANATAAQIATALNANSGFNALFTAGVSSNGDLAVVANSSANQITGVADATTSAGLGATVTPATTESTMTFQDGVSLQAGQEFAFNYELNGVQKSVTLQVGSDKTGTVESVGTSGNNVTLALNIDQVSGENITGSQIASAINTALTGTWYNADGTASSVTATSFGIAANAVAGTSIGVGVSGATLNLSAQSNGGKDEIVSVQPPQTDYQTLLNQVSTAQQAVINASASFGASQNWIESQQTYINSLVSTLQNGVGNLIDANMSAESAQLTALQTQQQLGTQVLAIANQQPASILSLFK